MNVGDRIKCNGHSKFSPDGKYVAVVVDATLVIRDLDTMMMQHVFPCVDKIDCMEWAPDSLLILCAVFKRATVHAWSLSEPDWTCRIIQEQEGLLNARWAPDGVHIITSSEFELRLSIWSLLNKAVVHVPWPKHSTRGLSFTSDGSHLAVATRHESKDSITVLSCSTWQTMAVFATDTIDLADCKWSNDASCIAVWDNPYENQLLLYSPAGAQLAKFQPYSNGLGVKTVSWSPCGKFLGVGFYNQSIVILDTMTWYPLLNQAYPTSVQSGPELTVYKEREIQREPKQPLAVWKKYQQAAEAGKSTADTEEALLPTMQYEIELQAILIPTQKAAIEKAFPKQGTGLLTWSSDETFVASRNDNMPCVVWIWEVSSCRLHSVLLQRDPVRAAIWHPVISQLAICTGNRHFYLWSPEGASCVEFGKVGKPDLGSFPPIDSAYNSPIGDVKSTNDSFLITDLSWSPDGKSIMLRGSQDIILGFFEEDSMERGPQDEALND